jgi:hypothetical protein
VRAVEPQFNLQVLSMSHATFVRLLPGFWLAAWVWAGPASPQAHAQKGDAPNLINLEQAFDKTKREDFTNLLTAAEGRTFNKDSKADIALVEAAARYYVQRFGVAGNNKPTDKNPPEKIQKDMDALRKQLKFVFDRAKALKNDDFLADLVREMTKSFRVVLDLDMHDYQVGVVNAGLMLEPLGATGRDEAGDFLADLVKNGGHELVKFYAVKGLRAFFNARPREAWVNSSSEDAARLREAARIEPLLEMLRRPPADMNTMSADELKGFHYVRREVIKALAATHIHAIPLLPPKGKVPTPIKAPVTYGLLQVLATKGGLVPAPTLSEKLEAAVGLLETPTAGTGFIEPRQQPELITAHVGRFLVDFCLAYTKDLPFFTGAVAKEERKLALLPWKASAERLREGLKTFNAGVPPGDPAHKGVQELIAKSSNAGGIFENIRGHKTLDQTLQLNPLREVAQVLRAAPNVYEKTPEPQVPLGK